MLEQADRSREGLSSQIVHRRSTVVQHRIGYPMKVSSDQSTDRIEILPYSRRANLFVVTDDNHLFAEVEREQAPRLGHTFVETKIIHLLKCRLPLLDNSTKKKLKQKVERVLAAKQRNVEADVSALEQELNNIVYSIYGLTAEEQTIVQSAIR